MSLFLTCIMWYNIPCIFATTFRTDLNPNKPRGNVQAVYDLLDRVLPGSKSHFKLTFADSCMGNVKAPCYSLSDNQGKIAIVATGASELTSGLGYYFRQYCNMTTGWPRGGGNNIYLPKVWPLIGKQVSRKRNVPWSYIMNVCTHSYSLVWYSWSDWQGFIDWMALNGINLVLAMTGQEEVQYKVFQKFGLNDHDIRHWFNGPALLTWSRGQNEYGADIAGPLPRSWMKDQWKLQKLILSRYRGLGIVGQLPAFQGNVPIQLKDIHKDANITKAGATGWMDSLDPLFGKIADVWMQTLIDDFGTDHWYQLDGYFNGATAPWMDHGMLMEEETSYVEKSTQDIYDDVDIMAYKRGAAAYQGLNRTDPNAIWSFQGWAVIGWNKPKQAAFLKGFVDATPPGKFVVIDMSTNGKGEWHKWNDSSFFGAHFIWTTLHDFGGTDAMKGNISRINEIPFAAMAPEKETSIWGTGFTPEGIDQNPVYYEFMIEQNWRDARVSNIADHIALRSHRRYMLSSPIAEVSEAWTLLVASAYSQDLSVQDSTGIPHLPGHASQFEQNRYTPSATLCKIFKAWGKLILAAPHIDRSLETFRYDLVNLGREVLAQLSTPMSMNFSDAMNAQTLNANRLHATGDIYVELLTDVDKLLMTDFAFLLGPWIRSARLWGENSTDCVADGYDSIKDCLSFYEWNARVQLSTWNPTPKSAKKIPKGPNDYASKHWSGLVKDYYGVRASLLLQQALKDASEGRPMDKDIVEQIKAEHAYNWTISQKKYPVDPIGDYIEISTTMHQKYTPYFQMCI